MADDDYDIFATAAERSRRGVKGGRPDGATTRLLERIAPAIGRSLFDLATTPGRAYREGITRDEAADWGAGVALNMIGIRSPFAELGGIGIAGGKPSKPSKPSSVLPMDEASRLAREQEMGFRPSLPLYHGTASDFTSFDLAKGGATTGAAPARSGVWSALSPQMAEEFAVAAADRTGGSPRILPLVHRTEKPGVIHLSGAERNHEIAATLAKAWDDGFDAVMLRNYTSPGGRTGDILVVREPSQLRSKFAAFDPAKKGSSDLLASFAGLGLAPAAVAAGSAPQAAPNPSPVVLGDGLMGIIRKYGIALPAPFAAAPPKLDIEAL